MRLGFETIRFEEEKERIKVVLLGIFYSYIPKEQLEKTGKYRVGPNFIEVSNESRFKFLLDGALRNLKNSISGHKAVYIHRNSGIPLIGSNSFGIVDRNTSLIEVKPITSCNLNCIYCSVDEGISSKKSVDYVVEKEYLVEELKKIIEFKENSNIHIHIGTQGEPTLYADLVPLVRDLSKIKEIKKISLGTNGTLMGNEIADELIKAGLAQFNISINSLDEKRSYKLAGCRFDFKKWVNVIKYISKKSCGLMLTPVLVPGYNDEDIEGLVKFSKKLKCEMGIQNFLNYKHGRNPAKAMPWEDFYKRLEGLEKKYKVKLIGICHDFAMTKKLPKPFKKGCLVQATVMAEGRLKGEMLAVAKARVITVPECSRKIGEKIRVRITRSKHNIFYGRGA